MRLLVVAALAGCYSAPSNSSTCTLVCEDSCPGELACVNGYCVADGERCEPTFTRVHAGNGFACALDTLGRRWCWGANDQHQLEDSDRAALPYATLVDAGPWDAITTGGDHACGLRDGALYCWGGNDRQQVSGTISGDVEKPREIKSPNRAPWSAVVAGYANTCGIAGGRLYCWGANNLGQVGVTGNADVGAPVQVTDITDWTAVSVGREHACAVSSSAGLYCWGHNLYGQLGDATTVFNSTPKPPAPVAISASTAVAASGDSTCAIASGQLYCWGRSERSALGDPAVAVVDPCVGLTSTPILASSLDGWTHIAASKDVTCALRTGDELWCWGRSVSGLGIGSWDNAGFIKVADSVTDVSIGWNSNIDELGADDGGLDLTCYVTGGAIKCWGDNRYGQLAQGAASMATTPTEIVGGHIWSLLATGDSHMCGIANGVPLCWGTNISGNIDGAAIGDSSRPCAPGLLCATGTPTPVPFVSRADALSLGDDHTCAIDGTTLTCWGSNAHYQLGGMAATSPAIIPGAWTTLYGPGSRGQCAAQGTETYCWGSVMRIRQPLARDTRLDGMKYIGATQLIGDLSVAGGQYAHGCALDSTNQLACFGVDTHGQFGRGQMVQSCGNGVCDIDEREGTCGVDCNGKRTCTTTSCGRTSCSPVCGDGFCNYGYGETCSTCAADCGLCPYVELARNYDAVAVNWNSGTQFTCGIKADTTVECWGFNQSGQAGALDVNGQIVSPVYTPNPIPGLSGCTAIAAGGSAACALCSGEIYCWGNHRAGAVGAGPPTAFPITIPRQLDIDLDDGDSWAQLVSGEGYNCARSTQGRGFCWGFHSRGALGVGGVSSNLPVDVLTAR